MKTTKQPKNVSQLLNLSDSHLELKRYVYAGKECHLTIYQK